MVGAGGQLLERSIVDRMVGAPERLVFEGKPVLVPPLDQDQDARRPVVVDGEMLDPHQLARRSPYWRRRGYMNSRQRPPTCLPGSRTRHVQSSSTSRLSGLSSARACRGHPQRKSPQSNAMASSFQLSSCLSTIQSLPAIQLPTCSKIQHDSRAKPWLILWRASGTAQRCKAKIRMLRADGAPWINSFAHGRTIYELKLDADAVRAAMDAVEKEEVLSTFA